MDYDPRRTRADLQQFRFQDLIPNLRPEAPTDGSMLWVTQRSRRIARSAVLVALIVLVAGLAWASEGSQPMGYVEKLETAYGPPSQKGFGGAVFHEVLQPADDLATAALAKYRHFVGRLWSRFGEQAWMGPWREVYARPSGAGRDIVAELRGIEDAEAKRSVDLLLDAMENAAEARAALAVAFDDPAEKELRVFNIGDGAAMSGLLVAGRRAAAGDGATYVIVLMD